MNEPLLCSSVARERHRKRRSTAEMRATEVVVTTMLCGKCVLQRKAAVVFSAKACPGVAPRETLLGVGSISSIRWALGV